MVFPPTYNLRLQQTGQLAPIPFQPDYFNHHRSPTSTSHLYQPRTTISVGRAAPWNLLPRNQPPSQSLIFHPEGQTALDGALRKIREYEETILHLTTLYRQSLQSVRTQRGIICPDCKQEVEHVCPSLFSFIAPSSPRLLPLNRYDNGSSSTLSEPAASLHTHFNSAAQVYTFGEQLTPRSPPPSGSNISGFASHSSDAYPYLPPYPHPAASTMLGNSADFQSHFTGPSTQESHFGERVTVSAASTHFEPSAFIRQLPPTPGSSSDVSVFTPHSHSFYPHLPPPPYPPTSVTLGTGATAQERLFDEHVLSPSTYIRRLPPTPNSSDTPMLRPHPNDSYPRLPTPRTGNYAALQNHALENHFGERVTGYSASASASSPSAHIRQLPPTPRSMFGFHPAVSQPPAMDMFRNSTDATTQRNLFDEHETPRASTYIRQLPPAPSSSDISMFRTYPTTAYPSTSTTSGNASDLQSLFTGATDQGDLFGGHETPRSFTSSTRPLPPTPDISTTSLSILSPTSPIRRLPPTPISSSVPLFSPRAIEPGLYSNSVSSASASSPESPYPPVRPTRPSPTMRSRHTFSNDDSCSGKGDLHDAHLEREPESTTSYRQDFSEDSTSQRTDSEFLPPTSSGDRDVTSEREVGADWSIRYNSKVRKSLDVTFVRSLHVGLGTANCLKFSKDGKYLAVGFRLHGTTNIYDVETGEQTCTLQDEIKGKDIFSTTLCFSPNGLYLAIGGTDEFIRIWEISKKHMRNAFSSTLDVPISCIDFSPDGRLVASGTFHFGTLHIWNWRDGSRKMFESLGTDINDIRFSPDGKHIAVGVFCGDVQLWNVRTAQMVEKLMGHRTWVYSLAFTPDGAGLVSGSHSEPTFKFWDISMLGVDGKESELQDGRTAAANTDAGKVELANFKGRKSPVFFVGVSSNNRWVFSCSSGGAIRIWDAQKAELHCELWPHNDVWLQLFDFSPLSGSLVASSDKEGHVLLWKYKEVLA